jgi:hypothetical protein
MVRRIFWVGWDVLLIWFCLVVERAVAISLGLLAAASNLPTANAFLSWNMCTKDE